MSRTQIYYGGSGSGKSVFLAQRAVVDILKSGRNYLVCRQVGGTVRKSVYTEIKKVIDGWGLSHLFIFNYSAGLITCKNNGYQVIFTGLDDPEKIKSITPQKGVITDIWIEEATETNRNTVRQLYKRQRGGKSDIQKRFVFSFNPILKSHWIYDEYFTKAQWKDADTLFMSDELSIQKTIYSDNDFLTPDDYADLENETDPYFYQVYTLGNWGILGNVIFTNWTVEDLSELIPTFANPVNGLDFGYVDPAAFVQTDYNKNRKTIYIYGEIYESGLTNDRLAEKVLEMVDRQQVTCDSAEPKSIRDLQLHGVRAKSAKKGKDSIIHGIKWLQKQKIVVHVDCVGMQKELGQYKWKEDKNGDAIEVPVDKFNHLIDATRYGYEDLSRMRMNPSEMVDFI
jgi:phage terminase large subunit